MGLYHEDMLWYRGVVESIDEEVMFLYVGHVVMLLYLESIDCKIY